VTLQNLASLLLPRVNYWNGIGHLTRWTTLPGGNFFSGSVQQESGST